MQAGRDRDGADRIGGKSGAENLADGVGGAGGRDCIPGADRFGRNHAHGQRGDRAAAEHEADDAGEQQCVGGLRRQAGEDEPEYHRQEEGVHDDLAAVPGAVGDPGEGESAQTVCKQRDADGKGDHRAFQHEVTAIGDIAAQQEQAEDHEGEYAAHAADRHQCAYPHVSGLQDAQQRRPLAAVLVRTPGALFQGRFPEKDQ